LDGIAIDPDGKLYVHDIKGNFFHLKQNTMESAIQLPNCPGYPWLGQMGIDTNGILWALFFGEWRDNYGLFSFDGAAWKKYTSADGLFSHDASSFTFGPDGSVWVGQWAGISRYHDGIWKNFPSENGRLGGASFAFPSALDSSIYFSDMTGIYKVHYDIFTRISSETSVRLTLGANGVLWCINLSTKQLMSYDGEIWLNHPFPIIPGFNTISDGPLFVDGDNTVWIWTNAGLYQYTPDFKTTVEERKQIPHSLLFCGNHPNPFNPTTAISFTLPHAGEVKLSVYDVTGRKVTELVNGFRSVGTHTVVFDGTKCASGVYIYHLESTGMNKSGRMLLLR